MKTYTKLTYGLILFLILGTAGRYLLAQDGLGPISPNLSPSLTEAQPTTPVTSLTQDFLVPQRIFVYDGTGASLVSNAFNPESIAAGVSNAAGQTDTAIRDSSQAGQFNPFASGYTSGNRTDLRSITGTVSGFGNNAIQRPPAPSASSEGHSAAIEADTANGPDNWRAS